MFKKLRNLPFTDREYGRILDEVVVTCVDTIVINKNKTLLGMRNNHPNRSWWFFGGRMNKGESFQTAARRGILRELSIDLDESRFAALGTYSLTWDRRREPPAFNGCHHMLIAMYVFVNDDEAAYIQKHTDHKTLKWFDLNKPMPEEASQYLKDIMRDMNVQLKKQPESILQAAYNLSHDARQNIS